MTNQEEKQLSSEMKYRGSIINVRLDEVQLPRGGTGRREVAEHPGAVAVVAETDEGKILMVQQYRYPVGRVLLEIPAGKLERGEDPAECACREMIEETGYRPGKLELLTKFYTSPGFCNELIYLYEGLNPGKAGEPEDSEENIKVVRLDKSSIREMIISGEIADAKTIIGLLWILNR